jgi:spore coat polysaccharide biosynthesis protein SpsF
MILAILQARVSSTRLPGKVLKPILGISMLQHQIQRVQKSRKIDQLVIATSDHKSDDAIEKLCDNIEIQCVRGSPDDVLDRFYQAATPFNPRHIVRLTGDCPLADAEVIDDIIEFYFQGNFDYASNTVEPTFPDGLDVEICSFQVLKQAFEQAKLPSQREHVTPFIYKQPGLYKIGNYKQEKDFSHFRWTVDEPEDFDFVNRVYKSLYFDNPDFKTEDILNLLNQYPKLTEINERFIRNEGMAKSLKADQLLLETMK